MKKTAQAAFDAGTNDAGYPKGPTASFVCPYPGCDTLALHRWGSISKVNYPSGAGGIAARNVGQPRVIFALCEACNRETIFIDGKLSWPRSSAAPAPSPDLPGDLKPDFEEARRILPDSPRGAAALVRLVIQKLLPHIGATKPGINDAIGELMKAGTINTAIQQALDSVRVIGNEAVHPGTLDLKDDEPTALMLFELTNFIVEKAITEPKKIAEIYSKLPPDKLDGIANRDKK